MTNRPTYVAVLGSTGSIGRNAVEVISGSSGRLQAVLLSAHRSCKLLLDQARRLRPRWVVVTDPEAGAAADWNGLAEGTEVLYGPEALNRLVVGPQIDVVLAAIVGAAGLRSTWAALEAGKTVALANKETLVMAGALVMRLAAASRAKILPVDSEHSAIFQALHAGRRDEVRRVVLTASGGPFLRHTPEQLAEVSVAETLVHPTWNMGPKVTVDSATMMNKALEIVEARWLFDLEPEQIEVVVHPQSVVHSLVEFIDGSTIAQISPPDMKLPIQYALNYPHRRSGPAPRMDFGRVLQLSFEPPAGQQAAALRLGWEAAKAGGSTGTVLNAANEAAVGQFLIGRLPFDQIVPACKAVVERHAFEMNPTLDRIFEIDRWAREETLQWINRCSN
ncbi:MAG TPA: 1-deoxy-D-xylulose-5-phosphate reductoisomerase [Pirellulales bacterium]|jgi:1-deoxy-D-xylulose-5-phosphate reductoisomerase|nr:1-deoxy-D-xylulose-5-phosphate reductoisomerase [Pirellulales bacterium]